MMNIEKHRRQVAWICFESYLTSEQRVQAIEILESGFQLDGNINLMAYVAKVCMDLGIDLQNHKTLYSQFHQLMLDTTELLTFDPLFFLLQKEQGEVVSQAAAELIDSPLQVDIPAYTVVFASFMSAVLNCLPNKIELFIILTELVGDKKLQSEDLEGYIEQWLNYSSDFAWSESLTQQTLTRLVHLVYMGLCELLGPVAADDCFHKALMACERVPEARIFPPSQFL